MRTFLSSAPLLSEGGLILQGEEGGTLCSELVLTRRPPVTVRAAPVQVRCERKWWVSSRAYTVVRADGLTVLARAEARSYESQADADFLALRRARCMAEAQSAAGLIPLEAENGAPLLNENSQPMTSEPITP